MRGNLDEEWNGINKEGLFGAEATLECGATR